MDKPTAIQQIKEALKDLVEANVPLRDFMGAIRTAYVREALRVSRGNACQAARILGIHRNTLTRIEGDPKHRRMWREKSIVKK